MRLLFSSSDSALRGIVLIALAVLTPIPFTGCGSSAFSNPPTTKVATPASVAATADAVQATSSTPPVLLFNGTGTSSSDVAAVEASSS